MELVNEEQRFLLGIVWETFRLELSWPDLNDLQRRLDNSGMEHRNVRQIVETIPHTFLHVDRYSWRGELRLTVEALAHCRETDELLALVPRFVQLCVDRYRESRAIPPEASMTRAEVAGRLFLVPSDAPMPARLLRQLYLLMREETYVYGGGSETAEGDWVFQIRMDDIRAFLHVTSLDGYLTTVARLDTRDRGEPARPPAVPRDGPIRFAGSLHGLGLAALSSVGRGASDAISQATKWLVLAILVVVVVGLLAIVGLEVPVALPVFPR